MIIQIAAGIALSMRGQDEASLPGGEQVALDSGTARGVRPIWQVEGLYAQKRYSVLHDLDYSMFHGAGKVLLADTTERRTFQTVKNISTYLNTKTRCNHPMLP